jgi:NDP-sugar pyrophosphorylase family protein/aminoglycoside/choline kinase family phosphotransferase
MSRLSRYCIRMSKFPLSIFLPAAGLGERLRPVTNHIPKPLLPILGNPLIGITLGKLTALCEGGIGINLHYKGDMIRYWADHSGYANRISFFPEDPILGTGGALKNAESFLVRSPFIVHNADILLDIDFEKLITSHLQSENIATLATHRHPMLSNVVVDDNDLVLDVENPGHSRPDPNRIARKVAYTGIAVYSPEILKFLPPGVSHATAAWLDAVRAGYRVQALDFTGAYWTDIGTPASYAGTVLDKLCESGEMVHRSPEAACGKIGIDGYVVLEAGSHVEDRAWLRNCIVMPGARISGKHENRILGPDYAIDLGETEMQPSRQALEQKKISLSDPLVALYFGMGGPPDSIGYSEDADAILIGLGGSDRRYFRVRNDGKTAVLMECRLDDPDYDRHLAFTRFFESHSVPVPDLIAADDSGRRALFEDLGDTSLYSYLKFPHDSDHIEDIYCSVLDILVKLHGHATQYVHECPRLHERIFGYDYLRWETNYFLEQFVHGLRRTVPENETALDEEFRRLAVYVDSFPKGIIHRDFQSQNIMITAGGMPRVIDFQGARMAPAAYDVASILWDPYYRLNDGMREMLLEYYLSERGKNPAGFSRKDFTDSLLSCRLQRHMQALGAYGFLSAVKGKTYFLKHVPEAVRMLKEETTAAKSEYPELYRTVRNF